MSQAECEHVYYGGRCMRCREDHPDRRYWTVGFTRPQMGEVRKALQWHAAGKAKSSRAWAVLWKVEDAMAVERTPVA